VFNRNYLLSFIYFFIFFPLSRIRSLYTIGAYDPSLDEAVKRGTHSRAPLGIELRTQNGPLDCHEGLEITPNKPRREEGGQVFSCIDVDIIQED
jgi:hypothetical protein